jgi:hypothetical protein
MVKWNHLRKFFCFPIGFLVYEFCFSPFSLFFCFSRLLLLSNLTTGFGSVIEGGGIVVNGIGDINDDGITDFMITNYNDWQGKTGSFLITSPKQWISNYPTIIPTVISVAPSTFTPSSFPTSLPTIFILMSNDTNSSLLMNETRIPSIFPSPKPSKFPLTVLPTVSPSFVPTLYPSYQPSIAPSTSVPTVVPSRVPSHRPTRIPSASKTPSFDPTSTPSLSIFSQGKTFAISSGGFYEGHIGNETILIASIENLVISGNQGQKRYVFSSRIASAGKNVTIIINDFDNMKDMLDFSQFPSSLIFNYAIDPLTFIFSSSGASSSSFSSSLPFSIVIILSSHSDFDLFSQNMILTSSSFSSSSSTSTSSTITLRFSFTSEVIVAVVVLFGLFVVVLSFLHWEKIGTLLKKPLIRKSIKRALSEVNVDIEEQDQYESLSFSDSVIHSSFFPSDGSGDNQLEDINDDKDIDRLDLLELLDLLDLYDEDEHSDHLDDDGDDLVDDDDDDDDDDNNNNGLLIEPESVNDHQDWTQHGQNDLLENYEIPYFQNEEEEVKEEESLTITQETVPYSVYFFPECDNATFSELHHDSSCFDESLNV